MRTVLFAFGLLCMGNTLPAQNVQQRIDKAMKKMLLDDQLKHAITALYVTDTKTNQLVYELNSQLGLAPASTQKIFTAIAALELLGTAYHFKTEMGYSGQIVDSILQGNIFIVGYGDPSLGSWRFSNTKTEVVLNKMLGLIRKAGIKKINGDIILDDTKFSYQPLPGGWIWDDIGNYYGAGSWALNWNENQYNLLLKPGKNEGDAVEIKGTNPELQVFMLTNLLKSGKPGSGDNAYIYLAPNAITGFVDGTVPAGENQFVLSGAIPNPSIQIQHELEQLAAQHSFSFSGSIKPSAYFINDQKPVPTFTHLIGSINSPSLDSLLYPFLQKSINLYGEVLVKTIAMEKTGNGSTEKGVELVRNFWQQNGIEKSSLKTMDGSGLSPQNRLTVQALVQALQFAKSRPWFTSFYNDLPIYNNMKMKSGTIGGSKAFAGYHSAANGRQYTFAIIINNFDGNASTLVQKMYKVLDELK